MASESPRYVWHSPAEITAKSAAFCPAFGVDEVGRKRMRVWRERKDWDNWDGVPHA